MRWGERMLVQAVEKWATGKGSELGEDKQWFIKFPQEEVVMDERKGLAGWLSRRLGRT